MTTVKVEHRTYELFGSEMNELYVIIHYLDDRTTEFDHV